MNKAKEKTMRHYFKRYLEGCPYDVFENWLRKYFQKYEISAIASHLFKKWMELWYSEKDDEEIIEKTIYYIEKYWFILAY